MKFLDCGLRIKSELSSNLGPHKQRKNINVWSLSTADTCVQKIH